MNIGLILTICSIVAGILLIIATNKTTTVDQKEGNTHNKTPKKDSPNKFYVLFLVIVFLAGYVFMNLKECSNSNYSGDSIEETIRHGD